MPLATVREAYRLQPDTFDATKQLFIGLNELAITELVAGRVTEARKIWCDALRLAPARYRGGVLIHYLVALAGERRTVETIRAHLDELPTAEQSELAKTLRQTGPSWEPLDTLFLRDRTLGLEHYGPLERTAFRLSSVLSTNLRKMRQHTERTTADETARRNELLRELEGQSAPDSVRKP
jgi:hypothetical protein